MANSTLVLVIVVATAGAAVVVVVARTWFSTDDEFDSKNLSQKSTDVHHVNWDDRVNIHAKTRTLRRTRWKTTEKKAGAQPHRTTN